jgi:hypothetical protein
MKKQLLLRPEPVQIKAAGGLAVKRLDFDAWSLTCANRQSEPARPKDGDKIPPRDCPSRPQRVKHGFALLVMGERNIDRVRREQ